MRRRPSTWSRSSGSPAASRWPIEPREEAGFTLIEVLVAFVVAALCLTVVMESFSASMDAAGRAEERLAALRFAQSRLAQVGLEGLGRQGTLIGEPEGDFAWTVDVEPLAPDPALPTVANLPALVRVSVRVSRGEPHGSPIVALETIRPAALP